jgi:archaellum component FlaC
MDPDLKTELDQLRQDVNAVQETLSDILAKVDGIVENVAPLVKQVEESPLFKMLGGKKGKKP